MIQIRLRLGKEQPPVGDRSQGQGRPRGVDRNGQPHRTSYVI